MGSLLGCCPERRALNPLVEKPLEPSPDRQIMHRPALEMGRPLLGPWQFHPGGAARGPTAHHGVGHFRVELDRIGARSPAESLDRKGVSLGQQLGSPRQVEAFAVPLIDVVRPRSHTSRPAVVTRSG